MNEPEERSLKEVLIDLAHLYTGLFLTGLVMIITVFLALIPSWISLADANKKLADRTSQDQRLTNKLSQLTHMDTVQMQRQLEMAVQALPASLPYETTLTLLSTLIEQDNLGMTGLTMLAETQGKETTLTINIKLVGLYEALQTFLAQTEQALPLVTIRSIELSQRNSPGGAGAQQQQYQSIIELSVHQSPPPETIGKASDPLPPLSAGMQRALEVVGNLKTFAASQPEGTNSTPGKSVGRLFQIAL